MGGGFYSTTDRLHRSTIKGYATKTTNELFVQNKKREIHKDMDPRNVKFREARDSIDHPNTVPIQLYLDVTGSMGMVPHEMIKNGLPTLISTLIQRGIKDVALMFGAIGDHTCDDAPLQVAQFESADEPLDMWLERTWLEGGGGGNAGESYLLAWYFAGNHIETDAWDKRKKKGFVFTVGDEPCLKSVPKTAINEIMGDASIAETNLSAIDLLNKAKERNHVFHIHVDHHSSSYRLDPTWNELLGQNVITIKDHTLVSKTIAEIVLSHVEKECDLSTDTNVLADAAESKMIL